MLPDGLATHEHSAHDLNRGLGINSIQNSVVSAESFYKMSDDSYVTNSGNSYHLPLRRTLVLSVTLVNR